MSAKQGVDYFRLASAYLNVLFDVLNDRIFRII